jgi:uncharacterized membrane protein
MDYSLLGFGGLKDFFNVHPMFVHFPVALFPSALLLYLLGIVLNKKALNGAGRACLYLAVAGGLAAVVSGSFAEDSIPKNEAIHHLMETHEMVAIASLVFGVLLSGWSFWQVDSVPRWKWGFLGVLAIAVYFVLQAADIGARMVYIEGAAVKPAVSVISDKNFLKNN